MTNLKNFIVLDYLTVKPYFTIKNLLIFSFVALFLTTMSHDISSGIGVGLMIATLLLGYPFAIGEKSNLDALYTTLSIKKKEVVKGRFMFALIINICAIVFSNVLAVAGLYISRIGGFATDIGVGGYAESLLILSLIFIFTQAVQIPFFFKLGYTKAKVLSIIPFIILMLGFMAFLNIKSINIWLVEGLESLSIKGMIVPLAALSFVIIVGLSYCLSVKFYKKREF